MSGGRAYQQSHPWISFSIDLRPAAPRLWSLLGQAAAGGRQIAAAALPPVEAAEMYRLYLSRGARATTAIEGNTLSEAQVRARLDGQLELPLSQECWCGWRLGSPAGCRAITYLTNLEQSDLWRVVYGCFRFPRLRPSSR